MPVNENIPDVSVGNDFKAKPKTPALHPLHEAAMRIAEIGRGRSKSKTKDLIGVLLCHGARAWRYSQPQARIHLHVSSGNRQAPVVLRLG
jgi:hypothetical protein